MIKIKTVDVRVTNSYQREGLTKTLDIIKYKLIIISLILFSSCSIKKPQIDDYKKVVSNKYKKEQSTEVLDLNSDGTYTLWNPVSTHHPINQCSYASKGKWFIKDSNLIEFTSENYYIKQNGYEYELKMENKFSQDSLYIEVKFPDDFYTYKPVILNYRFNYESIITEDTHITIPKSKYLSNNNLINKFNLTIASKMHSKFKSRRIFEILDEEINLKYNYYTIYLTNFDICFFDFEHYYKNFIYIKDNNTLEWEGNLWKKIKH
ncbi:putative porin [Aureivirga sp. CE67]|uniref:putative porin n=1 Tax=Aureivirga sp. CE67 TaxID=1788983 RepID=UPI0018C94EDC|nr:putative porin [Aureivirga sp. CE67]